MSGFIRQVICRPSFFLETELKVRSIRLRINSDDYGEWSAALKETIISLLENICYSDKAGGVLDETALIDQWTESDVVWSADLMLVKIHNRNIRRLVYFKEMEMERAVICLKTARECLSCLTERYRAVIRIRPYKRGFETAN